MAELEIPLGKRAWKYRLLEMAPFTISVLFVLTPFVLSIYNPIAAAYFILIYICLFLIRVGVMVVRVIKGYRTMQERSAMDWGWLLEDAGNPEAAIHRLEGEEPTKIKQWHFNRLHDLVDSRQEIITTNQLYHLVVVATYNESIEVLEPTIKAIGNSNYDTSKVIVYLAYEERGGEAIEHTALKLQKKYADSFFKFEIVKHPAGMEGEVIGKGGNITYAAKQFEAWAAQQQMNPDHVLVTTLDSDNVVHPNYLASITYAFQTTEHRNNNSYQPITTYLNNVWDVPAPMRLIGMMNTFYWSIQSTRPHQLRNFSAHAQPMAALLKTRWWSTRTVVEDGHQYWRSYFALGGHHDVVPTFVPISQDAVLSSDLKSTLKAQFIQLRRWAYGASDVAYLAAKAFGRNGFDVPKFDAFLKLSRATENYVSWAVTSLVLAGAAWAPRLISGDRGTDIIAQNLPSITAIVQTIGFLSFPAMIFIGIHVLPGRPQGYGRHRYLSMFFQWFLLPPVVIVYGSFTAFVAQWRLFSGRYIEKFDVTDKKRRS